MSEIPTFDLAISGGECLTLDPDFTQYNDPLILIDKGIIAFIGNRKDYPSTFKALKSINANGKLILPSFINGHTHLSLSLYRGLGTELHLHDWLRKVIWPLEKEFCEPDNVYLGSCLSLLEMIKSGTGTLADMDFFSAYVAKAIDESGLRGFLGEALFSGPTPSIHDPLDNFEVIRNLHGQFKDHPLIHTYLALHAPFSCSEDLYRHGKEFAREQGIKVCSHVAETLYEFDLIKERYGKTPVGWLESAGVLDSDFIAVHAVHLTEEDIDILSRRNVGVIHNPHSNMMLGSGICPVTSLAEKGLRVGIGTDSASSNNGLSILTELQTASKLQKLRTLDPAIFPARKVLRMATAVNADILGLGGITGELRQGFSADLILVDSEAANMLPVYDPYPQMVYSAENHNIRTLVVNGRIIMEDRKILTLDEDLILKEVIKWTQSVSVYDFINI
jgi:5-methylthioadenosine/S-adenosylhomocysteine deaminase